MSVSLHLSLSPLCLKKTIDLSHITLSLPHCGDDFHCWVEDKNGEVVFDPDFVEYELTQVIRNAMGPKHYLKWNDEFQQDCWSRIQTHMKTQMAYIRKKGGKNRDFWGSYAKPKVHCCPANCVTFMKKNKGKEFKIVLGSMGWEKPDGSVWWEWGNGYRNHLQEEDTDKEVNPDASPEALETARENLESLEEDKKRRVLMEVMRLSGRIRG